MIRRVTTSDGIELHLQVRPSPREPVAAVVLVHGFSASSQEPHLVATAAALGQAGYGVVTYDGRGHGASGGLCTLGDCERHDVAAASQVASELHDRVVLVGASMGGIAVLGHAATVPGAAGVVTVSSPAFWRFPRSARTALAAVMTQTGLGRRVMGRYGGVRLAGGWNRPDPPAVMAGRLSVPLAVIHGDADRFIARREAADLYRAAAGPSRLLLVPQMGHAYEPLAVPAILDAVNWVLEVGAPALTR